MSLINTILRVLFDGLLFPFRGLPPIVGIVVLSFFASVGMLYLFKLTSNQEKLEAVKRKIHASLFEIRLFNDDMPVILKAQIDILRHNAYYIVLCMVPMVFILPPFVLIMAQMESFYGMEGLEPGTEVVLTVSLDEDYIASLGGDSAGGRPAITLEAPNGIRVETPGVWAPSEGEVSWRIAAVSEGVHEVVVVLDGVRAVKTVTVGQAVVRRSPLRPDGSFLDQLLYPAEAPLPDESPMRAISLTLPGAEVSVFGIGMHWIILFFALTVVFAFALRKPMGVTI